MKHLFRWCFWCERRTWQIEQDNGHTVCATCEHLNGTADH
jgi:hypothetical protein